MDFSGAVNEPINLETGNYRADPKAREKLFLDLLAVYERGGIISCSIAVFTFSLYLLQFEIPWDGGTDITDDLTVFGK